MKLEYSPGAVRQLTKLDKSVQKRIKAYLDQVSRLENPRSKGKGLAANLAGLWRYRVGDYRIICKIVDAELIILALNIGHRKEIYD